MKITMNNTFPVSTTIILAIFLFFSGTLHTYAQKGFHMDEKKMIENFKRSTPYFEKGISLFKKEKFKKAKKEFLECLDIFPQHNGAYYYLAFIAYNQNDYSKALELMQKAKDYFKNTNKLRTLTHQTYLEMLQKQKQDLQADIGQWQDQLSSGNLTSSARQRIQTSIDNLKQKISQIDSRLSDPMPQVQKIPADYFYLQGNICFKLKKFQEAFSQYRGAIKSDPSHGPSYNNMANLYYLAKQYEQALQYLNKAEENGVKINTKFKKAILKALGK